MTGIAIEDLAQDADFDLDVEALLAAVARPSAMETVLISGGRKDKVRPGDILGALTGASGGLAGKDIGKIEIHDRLSYVAVAAGVAAHAVEQLNQGRIKGKRFRASLVGTSPPRSG
jgi:ATP-independent RNA helicase DbpA